MGSKIDKVIDQIEESGNKFIDEILIPIAKGGTKILINDNRISQAYLTFKTAFIENKISLFLEHLDIQDSNEISDFINGLKRDGEKEFFIESINKIIDLDDELQIFILTTITNIYLRDNNLNYYEKSIYYNIKQISKDDFIIYYCFYLKNILNNEKANSFHIPCQLENKEIIEIVLKKFISFGILKNNTKISSSDDGKDVKSEFGFSLSDYSDKLFEHLKLYFDKNNEKELCEKSLPINKSNQITCDDW